MLPVLISIFAYALLFNDLSIHFQSMEATKTLLRHSLRKKLDAALESETYLLIQHWCSIECQNAIKAYIDGKVL